MPLDFGPIPMSVWAEDTEEIGIEHWPVFIGQSSCWQWQSVFCCQTQQL